MRFRLFHRLFCRFAPVMMFAYCISMLARSAGED